MITYSKLARTDGDILYSCSRDESFIMKALSSPRKTPITLGKAIGMQMQVVDKLCREGKFKEAGLFAQSDLVAWISNQGFHIELIEGRDYIIEEHEEYKQAA